MKRCLHCGQVLPSTQPITQRQAQTLRYVVKYFKETGMAPTLREVAERLGVTESTAHEHLDNLARKGYVTRAQGGVSRGTLPTPNGLTSIYATAGED